tara:strand:- start:179 stop:853 length:675 start_codon:yes stop_codon:yes gene_type:complete
MPLTAKGKKLKAKFREQYGKKKGDTVFYAMENSGKLKKVIKARGGKDASQDNFGGSSKSSSSGGQGRDPSKQYQTKTNLSQQAIKDLKAQRKGARASITPSTTLTNQAIAAGMNLVFPLSGYAYKNYIDERAMGFPPPKRKKTLNNNLNRKGDERIRKVKQQKILPIESTKPVDESLIKPKDNFFNFVAYKVGGLSGGVSYGPPPKRGPNPQVPPIKMKRGGHK